MAYSKSEVTIPADREQITVLAQVTVRFDDPMRVTFLAETGPQGAVDFDRETGFDPVLEFKARLLGNTPAGAFRVEWHGLLAEVHPMQGSFGFSVTDLGAT